MKDDSSQREAAGSVPNVVATSEDFPFIDVISREDFINIEYLSSPVPGMVIFRANRLEQPGFLKLARNDNALCVLQLRSEWNILEELKACNVPNIPIPLLWLSLKDISGVFYSDSGYRTMRELYLTADRQSKPLPDSGWLDLMKAVRHVCKVLHGCHSRNFRHGNIRPDAIAINPALDADDPKSLILGAWFYASRLAVESAFATSAVLDASLSYIAPECTGRMNRSVDLRADLYSLGVTLYEVISGQVPFQGDSKLEIMHKHISQIAEPLSRCTSIPRPIELLISKLMMKNLEDRYQSAKGVLHDVEKIIQYLVDPNLRTEAIIIGQDDHASQFVVSRDFVGRKSEIQMLLQQYKELQSDSRTRVATIAGYSGVGKSRLVQEVLFNISQARIKVFYAECKFDQYKSFAPFAIMSSLVRDLFAQIFTEPPGTLAGWRNKIKTVLGNEAQSVVELCPDVVTLLTSEYLAMLPPLVPLGAMASEERLTRCLRRLIQAFASRERQLVVFVDDIQWSPPADLSILLSIREQTDLFLLCAYRDNEVGKYHIVKTIFLNNVVADVELVLQALSRRDATEMIAATLHRDVATSEHGGDEARDLLTFVDLIYAKTQGNAFFITQVLTSLYKSELLHFDFARRFWTWDIIKVQSVEMPEDVIGLVLRQLAELSPACQDILKVASCVGNSSFRLDILEITTLKSRAELAQDLFEAMSAGLVLSVDDVYKAALALGTDREWRSATVRRRRSSSSNKTHQPEVSSTTSKSFGDDLVVGYRFLHDKVQQAVYALITEDDRPVLHLRTGLRLLQAFGDEIKDSMLFDICSQINKGRFLLDKCEYPRLARLNLRAAQTAYQNTANETALMLLEQARKYTSDDIWQTDAGFAELYYELMEGIHASLASYEEAVKAAAIIIDKSQNLVIKTRMHGRQLKALMSIGRTTAAIATGVEGLTAAGIQFESYLDGSVSARDLEDATNDLWKAIPSSVETITQLRKLPIISDELTLAGTDIMINLFPPLYLSNPGLAPLLMLIGVMTSIKKGAASFTCYFMDFLGLLLCEIEDPRCNFVIANAWNQTAGFLLDELMQNNSRFVEHAGASLTLSGCVQSFTRDPRLEGRKTFTQAIELSQRCFDGQYMAYSLGNQVNTRLFSGENLSQIFGELVKYIDVVRSYKQVPGMLYSLPTLQTIHSLMYSKTRIDALKTSGFIVADMNHDRQLLEAGDGYLLHSVYFWSARLLLCLVLQDHETAVQAVISGRKVLHGAYGIPGKLHFETMASLVLFEQCDQKAIMPSELEDYLPVLCDHIEGWALQNPKNYQCWKLYVDAESKKNEKGLADTLHSFDFAIQAAFTSSNLLCQALFNERCARYLARLGLPPNVYLGYVNAAMRAYQTWGSPVGAQHVADAYNIDLEPPKAEALGSLELKTVTRTENHVIGHLPRAMQAANGTKDSSSLTDQRTSLPFTDSATSRTSSALSTTVYDDYVGETDLEVVIKSSLLLTRTLNTADLVRQLLRLLVQVAGAQHGALITDLNQDSKLSVAAITEVTGVQLYSDLPLDDAKELVPVDFIRLVANSKRCIIDQAKFVRGPTNVKDTNHSINNAKSFMALPVLLRDKILAVAYLSNDQVSNIFTDRKVELLTILAAQAATALEKSKIYNDLRLVNEDLFVSKRSLEQQKEELEEVVHIRTAQLQTQNDALSREIQQRKNIEKELVAAKDTAEQATAMKSRFLAMMSHEMRTPFNAVIGFSTLLLDTSLSTEQQDMAQSIVDSSTDLIAIINDILDFSKIENDKMNLDPVWFDMRSLIESTLEIVSRPANIKDIALAYLEDAPTSADWIFADNSRMRQCVLNLLSNAVKFTPHHGTVSVSTKLQLIDPAVNNENQQGILTVTVCDTGIGIAKQDQDKLFQFFSQVDDSVTRRFGGTGLGLAISHKICQLFGGDLTCESEEGVGSMFMATFAVQLNRQTHPTEILASKALTGKTCLILEPSKLLCNNLQQHLDHFGVKHFTRANLEDIKDKTDSCDFAIVGDHFNQPETIIALRNRGVSTNRLPLVVLMPFGATMPQQPDKKDLQSIDAVVSSPVRRVRLFRSLESLYPDQTGVCAFAKPTMMNLKTITSPGDSFPRKDISILLVEDNLVNVKVATQLMKRVGYVPKVAHDGLEAVAACTNEHFDLIFMDLSMPRMGGIQATREIRNQQAVDGQKPYICAMTANAMSGDQEKCIEAGMDDYITKPVLKPKLHAVLDRVRDMVVGTLRGHSNIEHIDHSKQTNSDELEDMVQTRRRSIQEQHGSPDFAITQNG